MAEVQGLRELSKKLSELGPAVGGKYLRSAAMSATLPVLREAQARAPVNDRDYLKKTYKGRYVSPGFLKRNIARKSRLSRDKRFAYVYIGPRPEAFYGTQFVELGTSKMAKNPWLEPAFRAKKDEVTRRLGEVLKRKIEQVAKK